MRGAPAYILMAEGIQSMLKFIAVWLTVACSVWHAQAGEAPPPGTWTAVSPTGCGMPGALVYAPARKQLLRWGTMGDPSRGNGNNEVSAFDPESRTWKADCAPNPAVCFRRPDRRSGQKESAPDGYRERFLAVMAQRFT